MKTPENPPALQESVELKEMRNALMGLVRILRAVRYEVGLGKNQMERVELAERILEKYERQKGMK